MTLNGRHAAYIIYRGGANAKVVSASVLARIIMDKAKSVAGSVDVHDVEIVGRFAEIGQKIREKKLQKKSYAECMTLDKNVFVMIEEIWLTLLYSGSDRATMRELYRTGRIMDAVEDVLTNISMHYIFINAVDNEHQYEHLTKTYREPDEINNSLMSDLDKLINGERDYKDFAKEFSEYEYGSYTLSHITRGVLRAVNYNVREHHIHINEDYKNEHVTLTIPEGKSATDREVTTLIDIFSDYIYPEENGCRPTFDVIVKGTLVHTKPQWWEARSNVHLKEN